jgi:hypothetical protein
MDRFVSHASSNVHMSSLKRWLMNRSAHHHARAAASGAAVGFVPCACTDTQSPAIGCGGRPCYQLPTVDGAGCPQAGASHTAWKNKTDPLVCVYRRCRLLCI